MATNTSNAIGMERQFSPQQQDVYQKQLQGIRSNTAGDLESSGGYRLARSLGIAGGNLINEARRIEGRNQRFHDYIGKYASSKNVNKLRDIQLILANSGLDEYADNPYTRASIARAEGDKAMEDLNTRYQEEVVDVKGWCKSQKEELDRFNKFVADHKHEYSLHTPVSAEYDESDNRFFDEGMYANYNNVATAKLHGQEAQAAENRKVIRNSTFRSKLDALTSPEYLAKTPIDQQIKAIQALQVYAWDMGMTLEETLGGDNEYVQKRVQLNGGAEFIDKLGGIVAYKDADGKPITWNECLPMDSYKNMAVIQDGNLLEQKTVDALDSLSKCTTVAEFTDKVAQLKKDNPRLYANLAERGTLLSIRENVQQTEEQAEKEQEQGMFGDGSSSGATGIAKWGDTAYETYRKVARGYLTAWENHQPDYQGRPISDALGVFTTNKNGETIFVRASREDVIQIGNEMLASLMDGKHNINDALKDFHALVTAPGFAPFRQSLAQSLNATLNGLINLNVDKIDLRSDNDIKNLQLALDIMHIDPVGAKQMYGTGNWTRLCVLRDLVPSTEDYWEFKGGQAGSGLINAVRSYGTKIATIGFGNIEYTQTKQSVASHFSGSVANIRSFNDSYTVDTTTVPIAGFPSYAKAQAIELATMYRLSGVATDAEAISKASADVAKQYGVANMDGQSIWIPLAKLHGLNLAEENKAPAIRLMIGETKKYMGGGNILVTWDDTAQELLFQNLKTGRTVPVKDLVNQINLVENNRKKAVAAQKQKEAQEKAQKQKKLNAQKAQVHKEAVAFNKAHRTNDWVEKNKHRKGRQF